MSEPNENCTHDCSTCSANCSSRTQKPESLIEKPNENSIIRNVIAVVSGKGGVGKSLVTSLLAVNTQRRDYRTAILDADLTGPSIPKAFGLKERLEGSEQGILPAVTKTGIQVVSLNLLLENETDPVVWRGPVIAGTVKQFWTDVVWNDVDYMYVDMPPGTGDVPLTVFQSLPVDGIILVASPQELVGMIVGKALNMAKMMNIPVLGIVENMSYIACPDCGRKIYPFGQGKTEQVAKEFGIPLLAQLPIDPAIAKECDTGVIELYNENWMDRVMEAVENCPKRQL